LKILFIVIDGLGDEPIKELGGKTPLEAALTPNLDFLARNGICGLLEPVFTTFIPTSEETHFALFGYDPRIYKIKRGIFTAQGAGIEVRPGDVALRGNFATVDEELNIINRRAGRITETQPLIKDLHGTIIDKVKFLIKNAGEHRIAIVLRGKNLSSNISDSDPHYSSLGEKVKKVLPLDRTSKTIFTAKVLNKFLENSHLILKNHPLNKERERRGLLPANYLLVRGASTLQKIPTFKERYKFRACCIAGKILYKQIGETLGMDLIEVEGANGLQNTNLKGKIQAAIKALKKPASSQSSGSGTGVGYDFCFLHIKAADSLAEDGNFRGKEEFIEKIDKNLKPVLKLKGVLIVITADHSTCSTLKRHCKSLVPVIIFGAGKNGVKKFSERDCQRGKIKRLKSTNLLKLVFEMNSKKN